MGGGLCLLYIDAIYEALMCVIAFVRSPNNNTTHEPPYLVSFSYINSKPEGQHMNIFSYIEAGLQRVNIE